MDIVIVSAFLGRFWGTPEHTQSFDLVSTSNKCVNVSKNVKISGVRRRCVSAVQIDAMNGGWAAPPDDFWVHLGPNGS